MIDRIKVFMGVDPSKSHTGITVWKLEEGAISLLYQGVVTNSALDGPFDVKPYRRILAGVRSTIQTYKPDFLFVEQMYQGASTAVTEMCFIAAFMVRWVAEEEGVPFRVVPPIGTGKGWRWFHIGGNYAEMKGGIGKVVCRQKIERDLGMKLKNEHIGDSASIALAGLYFETGLDYRTVVGAEIPSFEKVKKPTTKKPRKKKKE